MIHIEQLPLGPLSTNCYLCGCSETKQAALIDPSWDGRKLAEHITSNDWTLTHVLLTHGHFDHVGGLAELLAELPVPVYAHTAALPMIQFAPQAAQHWGIALEQPPVPDTLVAEGDTIQVGKLQLEVLFTPGHAPGHICFYVPEHAVLFDGDVLFQGSIGRTDLPGGDMTVLMQSINEKVLPLPDETHILSGHGAATTLGQEKATNPFLNQ